MTLDQAIDAHEALTSTEKKMVGALQEKWLTEDETGSEDGMWFIRAVQIVAGDQ